MSIAKKAVKAATVASAATLGLALATYEGALNIKLATKISTAFDFASKTNGKPKGEDEPVPEASTGPSEETYEEKFSKWYSANEGPDRVIRAADGTECHAYIIKNEVPSDKWVIICHGFTSGPSSMCQYAYEFNKLGFNCILPSLRGHAKDTHRYCSMGYYDRYIVTAFIDYILLHDPDAQIVLCGASMGSATVMLATGEDLPANVKAAVAECGYTNCYEQYRHVLKDIAHVPTFPLLPLVNRISRLRGNFDFRESSPIDAVAHSVTPTLFIHGDQDTFVPYSMMDEIYDACSAPKQKLTVEGAPHIASARENPELYWGTVREFLKDKIS